MFVYFMVDIVAVVMCFSIMRNIYLYTSATVSHILIPFWRHVLLQCISYFRS